MLHNAGESDQLLENAPAGEAQLVNRGPESDQL